MSRIDNSSLIKGKLRKIGKQIEAGDEREIVVWLLNQSQGEMRRKMG